jgi:hypothetical protein
MPNSSAMLDGLENGIFPQSLLDNIDQRSPCGFVPGTTTITSELLVPPGADFLIITGVFVPSDNTPLEDVEITLYGIDSVRGVSGLYGAGTFDIILTNPLPGNNIPYFLVPTLKYCNPPNGASRPPINSSQLLGISMINLTNPNQVSSIQLTVTLTWEDDESDIDLHIIEPNGNHVYFRAKSGDTGSLDFDDTVGYGPEHFTSEAPAIGNYTAYVNMYGRQSGERPIPWELSARIGTTLLWVEKGVFADPSLLSQTDNQNFSLMAGPFVIDTSKPVVGAQFNSQPYQALQGGGVRARRLR